MQYARYDPTIPSPSPVIAWIDTAPTFAPGLAPVSPDVWAQRGTGFWAVTPNGVVPFTPPPLPLPQQAKALLAGPVQVACVSDRTLNAAYAIDDLSRQHMTSINMALTAGMGLPGGGSTFNWPDTAGTAHLWTAASFTAFAKGVMNFYYAATEVVHGHSVTLPSNVIPIP
jgi:hypothetical protein